MNTYKRSARPGAYDKQTALVLQGGGALGSYQAGVFEALAGADYSPKWVAGISIGAINAAIIAGNAPENRVARLRSFWETITEPTAWWPNGLNGPLAQWRLDASAMSSLMFGQPGFFGPRTPQDWFFPQKPISYYNTDSLKGTLERLVDFDRINQDDSVRLSVGAVNVRTGRFAYFDSKEIAIRPEHVMASGALPPGFPPVEIDGEHYWDGGLVSNTPLQHLLDYYPRRSLLIFQVDVFQGYGPLPTSLSEVSEREKDIRYSSRTRITTDFHRDKHEVRHAINELHKLLPRELADTAQAKRLYSFGCVTEMDIVQLIYRPPEPQGALKDFEFSRATMNARWAQGMSDAATTLSAAPWLAPTPDEIGVRVFDVMHDILLAENKAAPAAPESKEARIRPRNGGAGRTANSAQDCDGA
jgi:NTE family protein